MKKYLMNFIVLTAMAAFLLTGCTEAASEEKTKEEAKEAADLEIDPEPDAAEEDTQKPEILHFVDVYQNPYQVKINPNVEKHNYKMNVLSAAAIFSPIPEMTIIHTALV